MSLKSMNRLLCIRRYLRMPTALCVGECYSWTHKQQEAQERVTSDQQCFVTEWKKPQEFPNGIDSQLEGVHCPFPCLAQ